MLMKIMACYIRYDKLNRFARFKLLGSLNLFSCESHLVKKSTRKCSDKTIRVKKRSIAIKPYEYMWSYEHECKPEAW